MALRKLVKVVEDRVKVLGNSSTRMIFLNGWFDGLLSEFLVGTPAPSSSRLVHHPPWRTNSSNCAAGDSIPCAKPAVGFRHSKISNPRSLARSRTVVVLPVPAAPLSN